MERPESLIDITRPPYNADPRGQVDSTAAFIRAINRVVSITRDVFEETLSEIEAIPGTDGYLSSGVENRKQGGRVIGIFPSSLVYVPTIYVPEGLYRVSDTLTYTVKGLTNSLGSELNRQIRIRGEGPTKSIIQLVNHASGFAGEKPKAVISLMRGERSNVSMSNYVEELGIDTGEGNPSAIGLDFFANNSGAVRRVRIWSGDGNGFAGLRLGHSNYSGVLLKAIEVDGFDYGLHLTSRTQTMYAVAEEIKLKNARICGIYAGSVPLSLRRIEVDQAPVGMICTETAGSIALVDSVFKGNGPCAIRHEGGALYLSQVEAQGFEVLVAQEDSEKNLDRTVDLSQSEMISECVIPRKVSSGVGSLMCRLGVEETPEKSVLEKDERTSGVRVFGAKGDGESDDTRAIQEAFNSGASQIVFEPGRYKLNGSISIPKTVRQIDFNFIDLVAGPDLAAEKGVGGFTIEGESEDPLFIERLFAWERWRGNHCTFHHGSKRTLVLKDIHTQTLPLYFNSVSGGKVFLENVATTAGVIPGATGHGRIPCAFRGQQVWARQMNPERGEPMVLNDGGSLWVLGFKSEDEGVAFHTINGGKTEVIGGVLNSGRLNAAAFVNENSRVRISCASNGWEPGASYGVAVREVRGARIEDVEASIMPSRQLPPARGEQFSIPLYQSEEYKENGHVS